jgi:hypothetical protein
MKVLNKVKDVGQKILKRAKHDDTLYLLLELIGGSLILAAPPLGVGVIFIKMFQQKNKLYTKKQLENSFYYFKKHGLINIESDKGNTVITLTKKGKERAELFGAGKLLSQKIEVKQNWDGKWRIVMFDLENKKTTQRNAIRLFLKRCGFVLIQKSVWVYPHDCSKEVNFIRSFFRLSEREFRFIVCEHIGDDSVFKKHFKI